MRATNGPLSLNLFFICVSDLNGLEAVIIHPKIQIPGLRIRHPAWTTPSRPRARSRRPALESSDCFYRVPELAAKRYEA
jgi:hypothetical protein